MPIRVLELRSVWGTGGGPDKTILAGANWSDPKRVVVTVCYIRDQRDRLFTIDRRARELGIDYVEVMERHSFDYRIVPAVRQIIRDRRIDIVHAHDHKTDAVTWLLAKVEQVIPLSTAHGFAGYSHSEQIYYAVEKRLLARFPKVIAVSAPIKAELVRTGSTPGRVVVINNAIDPHAFARDPAARNSIRGEIGLAASATVIGAVGRLEIEKRFDLLIEVFAEVRVRHPEAVLVIAGEGSLRAQLESLIDRLGLRDACRLLGLRADIVSLHSAFDLFVQSSEREGTPNAVLEAMALETPVVATDVGGTSELVTSGVHGLLVPKNDRLALAGALDRALSDKRTTRAWALAARARVETDLSFNRRMEKVERVYEELASGAVGT